MDGLVGLGAALRAEILNVLRHKSPMRAPVGNINRGPTASLFAELTLKLSQAGINPCQNAKAL